MKQGEKYQFAIIEVDTEQNTTIITDHNNIPYTIKGEYGCVGDTVEFVIANTKQDGGSVKYYFSQEVSNDGEYKLSKLYTLKIETVIPEGALKILDCTERSRSFKIRVPSNFDYKEGDFILCRPNWILGDRIDFYVITLDYNYVFEVGHEYVMTVVDIEEESKYFFIHSNISKDGKEYKTKIICNSWVYYLRKNIERIHAKYIGDGKWELNYSKIECPIYEVGLNYSLTLKEKLADGFFLGRTDHGLDVRVLQPFTIVEQEYLNKNFKYQYNGVDERGYLIFRQKLSFTDIIDSKALKVIAFDNIRTEYENNSEIYHKLFNDYDSKNNLWVLSYGNALFRVIDDKVKNKQWDTAYLISEVLEKIEYWIIESGYLSSFSLPQRETIKANAVSYLRRIDVLSKSISIIIEDNFEEINISLRSQLDSKSYNLDIAKTALEVTSKVFEICSELPLQTIELLSSIFEYSSIINADISVSLNKLINNVIKYQDNLQKKAYSQVFINPVNQARYFNNKEELKTCIILLIWIVKVSAKSTKQIYQLMLFRHLTFFHPDISAKEKFISGATKIITSQKIICESLFSNFSLVESDVSEIVKGICAHIDLKAEVDSVDSKLFPSTLKIDESNSFGYVFRSANTTYFLPFKEANIKLKKGEDIKVEVVAYDPLLKFGLITQSRQKSTVKYSSQNIEVGNVIKGIIKNVVDFGIFITVDGKDGLLHSSNVSHNSTDLKKIFTVGDEITVKVLSLSDSKIEFDRISILNELASSSKLRIGDQVEGTVFRIDEEYGIFLELENGANGYINKKNVFFNKSPELLSNCFAVGEVVTSKIIRYDRKKGYELSIKQNFDKNPIGSLVIAGKEYEAKVILVNDLKQQIGQRLGVKDLFAWSPSDYYCPKCQKENYFSDKEVQSFLEISNDNKKWQCLWCDYKSSEQLIVKFLAFPVIGYFPIGNLMIEDNESLIGQEFSVRVKEIEKNRFIEVDIIDIESEIEARPRNLSLAKRASAEMGFVYEQYALTSSIHKEELLNLCKYFFGFSGMARSYFHSFFNEYSIFINQIFNFSAGDKNILSSQASDLVEYFSSETKAIEAFPILSHIINSLKIISLLKMDGSEALMKYINLKEENKDSIELVETINLAISFICMSHKHLKEDIWELLLFSLKNYLFLINENELNKEVIELRKRIRMIINSNIEDELTECKGSFLIPIPSKNDLSQLKSLEGKLHLASSNIDKDVLKSEISKLKSPAPTKEKKDIVTLSWIKTIAAFANTNGGELLIGVGENDKGDLVLNGIEKDLEYFKNEDNLLLSFDSQFEKYIGDEFQHLVKLRIVRMEKDVKILYVLISKSDSPVFVKYKGQERFFIRRNVSTKELTMREFSDYKDMRFIR
jgi:predicted RNA-binding protein with RPS1 domain